MADGSVTIEVTLTKEQLEKGLKSVNNDLKKLQATENPMAKKVSKTFETIGSVATKAGKKLTMGLTVPLSALAVQGIKYNMSMETYLNNITVLLKGNEKEAKKLLKSLKDLAKTTPYETSDLVKATQTMMGFGISAKDSQKYLKQLGDISMGDKDKLQSLTLAFSQMKSAGKLMGQDLLQMINAGFNPLNIMAQKTGKSVSQLKEEMSKGKISADDVAKAFQWATEEGGLFYNGMEKGAQTTQGKISTLKDTFNELLGGLTEAFLPTVLKFVEGLTNIIDKLNSLDSSTKNTIAKILLAVASLGPILLIIGKISTGISQMINLFIKLKGAFAVGGAGAKVLSSALTFITSPAGIVIAVILGIIAIMVVLYKKSETFRNAVNSAFSEIKNSLMSAWETIKPALEQLWDALQQLLVALQPIAEFIVNVLVVGIKLIGSALQFLIPIITQIIVVVINVVTTIMTVVIQVVTAIINFFTVTIPTAFTNFISTVVNFVTSIIDWFKNLPYNIGYAIGQIIVAIAKLGIRLWQFVTVDIPKIIQNIINWFKSLPSKIWNFLLNVAVKMANWIVDMKKKVQTGIPKVVDAILNFFKNLPQNMLNIGKNIIEGLWNGIKNAKDWIVDKIKGFAKGILNGMKDALGIHSPSTLFRDEVGKFIALGVGEGFEKNIAKVYKNMKSAVDFETQKLSANLSTQATFGRTLNANITLESPDIYMDSTKVGRVVTPVVSRTLRTGGAY